MCKLAGWRAGGMFNPAQLIILLMNYESIELMHFGTMRGFARRCVILYNSWTPDVKLFLVDGRHDHM